MVLAVLFAANGLGRLKNKVFYYGSEIKNNNKRDILIDHSPNGAFQGNETKSKP